MFLSQGVRDFYSPRTFPYLPRPDDIVVAKQVSRVSESINGEIDLFATERPRTRQRLHEPPELERVKTIADREERRKESLRLLREAIHVGEVARLVHLWVVHSEGFGSTQS